MNKDFIYNRRKELGLTQDDVARACGVTKTTVCKWEAGEIRNMRGNRIQRLAEVLQVSPLAIIGYSPGADIAINDKERELIIHFRKQPAAVQEAILRMLGIEVGEKGSGVSAS